MRKFTIEKRAEGWVAVGVRGNIISGPHDEEWKASLYGTHAACAPSLQKRLSLKKIPNSVDGTIGGRPFAGVYVEIVKVCNGTWQTLCEVDNETRELPNTKTKNEALEAINEIGNEIVKTHNLLNPEAGEIDIARRDWGGCTDPGTERYWSM
jgi:hypothetical protein